ncbi:MAG: hypothetical protein ACRBK7_10360 [Acidimicrobiales bacterium]
MAPVTNVSASEYLARFGQLTEAEQDAEVQRAQRLETVEQLASLPPAEAAFVRSVLALPDPS